MIFTAVMSLIGLVLVGIAYWIEPKKDALNASSNSVSMLLFNVGVVFLMTGVSVAIWG